MRKAAVRHPLAASAAVVAIFIISMLLGSFVLAVSPPFFLENGEFLQQMVAECLICLVGIAMTAVFGYFDIWGSSDGFGKGLQCGGYILAVSVLSAVTGLLPEIEQGGDISSRLEPGWKIFVFIITMFLIGIGEESFFRGVISNLLWDKHAKDPAGVWTATIYSGLVFGLMHVINILGSDPVGVLVQMSGVIAMGMALTAIYYRCRNIWAVIFLHGFLDLCGLLDSGLFGGSITAQISEYGPVTAITSTLPYLIVTLVLLRKSKMAEIFAPAAVPQAYNPQAYYPQGYGPQAYNPAAPGTLVLGVEINSSPESKRSRSRAIAAAVIIWAILFTGSVALSVPGYMNTEVLDYADSGTWNGDRTFGKQTEFYVPADGTYKVKTVSRPSFNNAYTFVQITKDGEVLFEQNYGGKCSETFSMDLEKGNYTLKVIYNFTEVQSRAGDYYFTMDIERSQG